MLGNILNLFVNTAYADTAANTAQPPPGGSMVSMFVMVGIVILFMYFVSIRPQTKRAKEHRNLLNSLSKGDEVMTSGGILGKIAKLNENYVALALTDSVEITVQKSSIVSALPKGTIKSVV
jgi:preprotein translocase subunit YajC